MTKTFEIHDARAQAPPFDLDPFFFQLTDFFLHATVVSGDASIISDDAVARYRGIIIGSQHRSDKALSNARAKRTSDIPIGSDLSPRYLSYYAINRRCVHYALESALFLPICLFTS